MRVYSKFNVTHIMGAAKTKGARASQIPTHKFVPLRFYYDKHGANCEHVLFLLMFHGSVTIYY